MDNFPFAATAAIFIFLFLVGLSIYWTIYRSQQILNKWAHENGLTMISVEPRFIRRGPFFFSGEGQRVFRITVQDEWGREMVGWARCGSWWWGLMVDKVEVRWDE